MVFLTVRRLLAAVFVAGALLCGDPAHAADGKWIRAESEHFIAYGEISETELRDSIRELETLDALLRWLTSVGPGGESSKLEFARFKVSSNVSVTRLPTGADKLLLPLARIRLRGPEPKFTVVDNEERLRARKALYDEMRALTAALPGDPFAARLQAYAEVFAGEPLQAKPLLEAALATDANDVDALYLTGMMYLMQAEEGAAQEAKNLAEGRAFMGRAFKLTDSHVPTLYHYARSFPTLSENTLNVLMRAQMLAPQSAEIGLNTASALISMRRYEEAATILRPFAASPHGDGGAARRMLDEIGSRVPAPPASTMTKP